MERRQGRPADDHLGDLAGAARGYSHHGIPQETLDLVFLHDAVGAVNFDGLFGAVGRRVAGVRFGHGAFRIEPHILVLHPTGPVAQQPADVQLRVNLGHRKADRL